MPAAATHLRGMSRVNRNHRTAAFLSFVPDLHLEALSRPRMHPAFGSGAPFGLHPLANVFEVFQHDRRSWIGSRDDLLTEHMIGILPKPRSATLQLPQM